MSNPLKPLHRVRSVHLILDLGVRVAFIVAAAVLSYSALARPVQTAQPTNRAERVRPEPRLPTAPVSLDGATLRGGPEARVAIIEYSDFECPFCSKFAVQTLPALDKKYIESGQVLLAFRHLPLPIHKRAEEAAEAAECAARHGKFWEMHDLLFRDRRRLADADLMRYAAQIGLEPVGFQTCMKSVTTAKVRADVAAAEALGISSTPTFLLGTLEASSAVRVRHRISGARPVEDFQKALDALLAQERR